MKYEIYTDSALCLLFSPPECVFTIRFSESLKNHVKLNRYWWKKQKRALIINKEQKSQSRVHTNIEGYLHNYTTYRYLQIKQPTLDVFKVNNTKMKTDETRGVSSLHSVFILYTLSKNTILYHSNIFSLQNKAKLSLNDIKAPQWMLQCCRCESQTFGCAVWLLTCCVIDFVDRKQCAVGSTGQFTQERWARRLLWRR